MPQSTRDEILLKYASLMQPELIKLAWSWKDLAQALIPEVGIPAAIGTGVGLAAGTGLAGGVGAAVALGASPIGWVLGTALLGWGLYDAFHGTFQITDNNLNDLVSRIKVLDPNENAKQIVDDWIKNLEAYKTVFVVRPLSGNKEQDAQIVLTQLGQMKMLVNYLATLKQQWPEVKKNLTDVGWDIGEAENAINLTSDAIQKQFVSLQQKLKEATIQVVQQSSKKSGKDYLTLANDISSLYSKVVSLNQNQAPGLTPSEDYAWNLAQKILLKTDETIGEAELEQGMPHLTKLKSSLEQAINYLSKSTKKSSYKPAISKRALVLADGTQIGDKQPTAPTARTRQVGQTKNNTVAAIQTTINNFKMLDRPDLVADGIFGPQSAASLNDLMVKIPELEEYLKSIDITGKDVFNYNELNKNQEKLNGIYKALAAFQKSISGGKEENKDKPEAPAISARCPIGKDNMDPDEIASCLMTMTIQEKGRPAMRASEWLAMWGYRTVEEQATIVNEALQSRVTGLPGDWINRAKTLRDYVIELHDGVQPGPGQMSFRR
ncbi:MAG: hypothetical protein WC523_00705 [Patescibacteria group bacterium]